MRILKPVLLVLVACPFTSQADSLFGHDWAAGAGLPRAFGIGVDYFNMDQPYQLDSLAFVAPPGAPFPPSVDPSLINADNDIEHFDIKVDVWLLPFLNVFGIYGQIDGQTAVDLSGLNLGLPPGADRFNINYDGDVFGGGVVVAIGGDRWFGSVTATFTDTDLSGDFNSSVSATTIQPRVGVRASQNVDMWVGGYIIDAEESHSGVVNIDLGFGIPVIPVDFAVDLSQESEFNPSVGMRMALDNGWEATVEVGGGDRTTALGNITWRFE